MFDLIILLIYSVECFMNVCLFVRKGEEKEEKWIVDCLLKVEKSES